MSTRAIVLLCGLGGALLTAGCDEGMDLGHPPPVLIQTEQRAVSLGGRGGQERLHRAIAAVADGNLDRVRAVIHARSTRQLEATRRLLVRLGVDPVRIRESGAPGPDVELSGAIALTAPCASAIEPTTYDDPLPSLTSLADCNQTNNLARMVADPADLVAPPPLGPGNGTFLADGIRTWQSSGSTDAKQQPAHETTNINVTPSAASAATQAP